MSKVLLGITGSIACYKAAEAVSSMVQDGHEVRVLATDSALRFIGAPTLEALSGHPVLSDLFATGQSMDHIHLGRWADKYVILPCSANTMAKLKVGLADDVVTATALAFEKHKPIYIAPAMNKEMWSHSSTKESLVTLIQRNYKVIQPTQGHLACGEHGAGRLPSWEEIKSQIFLPSLRGRVLVTGGGTREAIDSARFIGNTSSGRTGAEIARYFSTDYQVDWLCAEHSPYLCAARETLIPHTYSDYASLSGKLKSLLESHHFDMVIHAAAVSDYSVDKICIDGSVFQPSVGLKLKSTEQLELKLKINPKIINEIKAWSQNPNVKLVGFKLTSTSSQEEQAQAVQRLFSHSNSELVVHNDTCEINSGCHIYRIIAGDRVLEKVDGPMELARSLKKYLESDI